MEHLLKPDYWFSIADSIKTWLVQEIITAETLINFAAIAAGLLLAWLLARPLKAKVSTIIASRNLEQAALGRFLRALEQTLTFVIAAVLLWLAIVVFRQLGLKTHFLNLFESLLAAWVFIRLITSVVRQTYWARLIAVTVWTVAALHFLSILQPTLALLDSVAVTFGDTRLSILSLIKALIFLLLFMPLALSLAMFIERRISELEGLAPSVRVLLSKTITIILMVTAVLIAFSSVGIDLYAFAFIGGAVGIGVGFGLQKVVSNLVSGFVILLDRSLKPGDVVAIDDTYGQIKTMGARYVSIVTRDGSEYLVPNEDMITNRVVNWSFSTKLLRVKIGVGVAYGSDVHRVMDLMIEAARKTDRVLDDPRPVCQLKNFGDHSIDMELRIWIEDPENGVANVSSAVRLAIWEAFQAHGIEIPFPQRVVHMPAEQTK